MNKRNRTILFGILGMVALVAVIIVMVVFKPEPTTKVHVLGGDVYLNVPEVIDYLKDEYSFEVTFQGSSSWGMAYRDDLNKYQCIWPGAEPPLQNFINKHPEFADGKTGYVYSTNLVIYGFNDHDRQNVNYVDYLVDAGYVYVKDGFYYMRMHEMLEAMFNGLTWRDIGLDVPGRVWITTADPLQASSGAVWNSLIGNYYMPGGEDGGFVLTEEAIVNDPAILDNILRYWGPSGLQAPGSIPAMTNFLQADGGIALTANYESALLYRYALEMSDSDRARVDEGDILIIYPEVTIRTDHILKSLNSPECDALIDIFMNDTQLQQIAWDLVGMRNGYGNIGESPGPVAVPSTVIMVPEPPLNVSNAIRGILCNLDPKACE